MFEILMIIWNVVLTMFSAMVGMDLLYKHKWLPGGIVMFIALMAIITIAYLSKRLMSV